MDAKAAMEIKSLLDKINEQTSLQEVRQIVSICRQTLAKETEPIKLWRSSLAWRWVIGALIVLLAATIAKFCSNSNWIAYARVEPVKPGTPIIYDIANLIIYGLWIVA